MRRAVPRRGVLTCGAVAAFARSALTSVAALLSREQACCLRTAAAAGVFTRNGGSTEEVFCDMRGVYVRVYVSVSMN